MKVFKIAIINSSKKTFSYLPIQQFSIKYYIYQRVIVPFRSNVCLGIIIKIEQSNFLRYKKIKRIIKIVDYFPLVGNNSIYLLRFIIKYFQIDSQVLVLSYTPLYIIALQFKIIPIIKELKKSISKKRITSQKIKINLEMFGAYLLGANKNLFKTYLNKIHQSVRSNKQVVVLFTSISRLKYVYLNMKKNISEKIYVSHKYSNNKQKYELWNLVQLKIAKIIFGTQEALLLPFTELGLMIIDRSYGTSYILHKKYKLTLNDFAVIRAKIESIPVIFSSNFISLNCYYNYKKSRYSFINNIKEREKLPLNIVRSNKYNNKNLSTDMISTISYQLKNKKQVILLSCEEQDTYIYEKKKGKEKKIKIISLKINNIMVELKNIFPNASIDYIDKYILLKRLNISSILLNMKDKKIDILISTNIIDKFYFSNIGLICIFFLDSLVKNLKNSYIENKFQGIIRTIQNNRCDIYKTKILVETQYPNNTFYKKLRLLNYLKIIKVLFDYRQYNMLPPLLKKIYIICFSKIKIESFTLICRIKHLLNSISNKIIVQGPIQYIQAHDLKSFYWKLLVTTKTRKSMQKILYKLNLYLKSKEKKNVYFSLNLEGF